MPDCLHSAGMAQMPDTNFFLDLVNCGQCAQCALKVGQQVIGGIQQVGGIISAVAGFLGFLG